MPSPADCSLQVDRSSPVGSPSPGIFQCGEMSLSLAEPLVMGILNCTPDSFADGGRFLDPGRALEHAQAMVAAGAALIDVGGESTRPGAAEVSAAEELRRILPVVQRLCRELTVPVSVDTSKPEVMRAVIAAGARMINDVNGLRAPGGLEVVAGHAVGVCLMHMQGTPRSMQEHPVYQEVVGEVAAFLRAQAATLVARGVAPTRIAIDPGFGFGKTLAHNQQLFRGLPALSRCGYPLLVGISRKSMLGHWLGQRPVDGRLQASVTAALLAAQAGARILRVHDVAETVDALRIWSVLRADPGSCPGS